MRKFLGKVETKEVDFMDDKITIRKLSAGAVKRVGEASVAPEGEEVNAFKTLVVILSEAVILPEGEEPITEELLEEFPLDALNKLAGDIIAYAGIVEGNELG